VTTMGSAALTLVAAVAANGVIGGDNQLLWRLPEDMKRFKALTSGHPVIMGRKTWESLPEKFRPLPNRRNIVISRNAAYAAPGAEVFDSLEAARDACAAAGRAFVIGGGDIYAQALPLADCLELTELHLPFAGDAYFPPLNAEDWQVIHRACHQHDGIDFDFVTYERKAG
jgi:dihydrofolate reductase